MLGKADSHKQSLREFQKRNDQHVLDIRFYKCNLKLHCNLQSSKSPSADIRYPAKCWKLKFNRKQRTQTEAAYGTVSVRWCSCRDKNDPTLTYNFKKNYGIEMDIMEQNTRV